MSVTLTPVDFDPFADGNDLEPVRIEPPDGPSVTYKQVFDNPFENEAPEIPSNDGMVTALAGGFKQALNSTQTAFNVATDDEEDVRDLTAQSEQIPRTASQDAFMQSLQQRKTQAGDDSVWQGIKNVAGAAVDNPKGAFHEVLAQLPNSAVVMSSMAAGAKIGTTAGLASPLPGGAAVGGIAGGILGLFFGNSALEVGGIAQEQVRAGDYDREEALTQGAIKGGVITAVDAATMGATKMLFSPVYKAAETASTNAIAKALTANGINPLDDMAIPALMKSNPTLARSVIEAGTKAAAETMPKGFKSAGLHGTSMGLEMIGEGAGEYGGSLAAGLDASLTDAVMESMMSIPQSAGEVAIGKTLAQIPKSETQDLLGDDKGFEGDDITSADFDGSNEPLTTAMAGMPAGQAPGYNPATNEQGGQVNAQPFVETDPFTGQPIAQHPEAYAREDNQFKINNTVVEAELEPTDVQNRQGNQDALNEMTLPMNEGVNLLADNIRQDKRDRSETALNNRQQAMGQGGMYQFNQGMADQPGDIAPQDGSTGYAPDAAVTRMQDAMEADDARRVESRERSVTALEGRQTAMRQADMPGFQRGLEAQPADQTTMPPVEAMPGFQEQGQNLPFSGLGDMMTQADVPEQAYSYDDGIDVASNAEFEPESVHDQRVFQQGLDDGRGGNQDSPGANIDGRMSETAMQGRPVFEHEVEPEKVNTNPTEAEKESGEYDKDHIRIDNLDISIENPDGSTRKGKDPSGKAWESTMSGHYGFFDRTEGKDGDEVDTYIKPGTETSPKVFVIDQYDTKTDEFDEHKVVLGAESEQEAKDLYLSNYEKGWTGFGEITEMNQEDFKTWLGDGTRTKKPLAGSPVRSSTNDKTENVETLDGRLPDKRLESSPDREKNPPKSIDEFRAHVEDYDSEEMGWWSEKDLNGMQIPFKWTEQLQEEGILTYEGGDDVFVGPKTYKARYSVKDKNPLVSGTKKNFISKRFSDMSYPGMKWSVYFDSQPSYSTKPVTQRRLFQDKEEAEAWIKKEQGDTNATLDQTSIEEAPNQTGSSSIPETDKGKPAGSKGFTKGNEVNWTDAMGIPHSGKLVNKVKSNWFIDVGKPKPMLMPESKLSKVKGKEVQPEPPTIPLDKGNQPDSKGEDSHLKEKENTPIGTNSDGQMVYQDENGARSYQEDGFLINQKVKLVPGGTSTFKTPKNLYDDFDRQFLTRDEIQTFRIGNTGMTPKQLTEEDWSVGDMVVPVADHKNKTPRAITEITKDGMFKFEGTTKEYWPDEFEADVTQQEEDFPSGGLMGILDEQDKAKAKNEKADKDLDIHSAMWAIMDGIIDGGFKTITQARKAVAEKLGIPSIKGGTLEAKMVDEVVEVAAVKMAKGIIERGRMKGKSNQQIFDELVDLQDKLPNLSTRTSTSIMNQAYSTPIPLAWVATVRAGIDMDTTVYEPSAGNGALLIGADAYNVQANEMNPDRASNLSPHAKIVNVGDGTQHEADPVDVVIANPPFGIVKDEDSKTKRWDITEQYSTSQIDHAMVFKSLEAMKPDGKAVLIIGSVMDSNSSTDARKKLYRSPDKVRFYKTLFEQYNVTDHFTMAGKMYRKQGAGWPVDVIIIDGKGKSPLTLPGAIPPRYIDSIESLKEQLNEPIETSSLDSTRGNGRPKDNHSNPGVEEGADNQGDSSDITDSPSTQDDNGGGGSPGDSRNPGGTSGNDGTGTIRPNDTQSEHGGVQSDTGQSEVSGISEPGTDGGISEGTDQGQPGGKGDPGGRQGPGPKSLDGESNQSIEDEFANLSEDNLDSMLDNIFGEEETEGNPEPREDAEFDAEIADLVEKSLDEQFSNLSENDLDSMLDGIFGEEQAETPAPEKKKKSSGPLSAEERRKANQQKINRWVRDQLRKEREKNGPPAPPKKEKGAKDHAKDAGLAGLSGVKNAIKGLGALFSPKNTLSSGFVFNEETYAAAKPFFVEAYNDAVKAKHSVEQLLKHLAGQFGAEIRPYLRRFALDPDKTIKKKGINSQVDYIPSSKSSVIGTLTPVNMAKASQKALKKIQEKHGSVDKFVADQLGYTVEEVIGKPGKFGYFSGEQVDAIALAIDNISNGAGFIIGDQTGVGKGRVVAAMQRYAMQQGLTPIFVTEKPNLYTDMYRDFQDIGMHDMADKILITNANKEIPLTEDGKVFIKTKTSHNTTLRNIMSEGLLPEQYKTIFTTYDQLSRTGNIQRQFIETMVRNRGMLIMDESHNAGGTEGNRETPTKLPRSIYFRRLVNSAHSVFYSSATYAKRPGIMDLYAKTDMRLAVDDIRSLGAAILKGGVPLQQAVAAMLVEAGQYVRRERSFDGVEYKPKTTEIHKETASEVTEGLAEIKNFSELFAEPAIDDIGDDQAAGGNTVGGNSAAADGEVNSVGFSSVMHNLIDQMLLSMKVEGAAQAAIKAFEDGQKPVIAVANTMGSFIKQYAEDHGLKPGDGIGLRFNDLVESYLEKTRRYTITDPITEEKIPHYISDAELGEAGLREFNRIRDKIRGMDLKKLPVSPVDYIMKRLEDSGIRTSEITGREDRIEYRTDGIDRYTKRTGKAKSIAARIDTIYNFNWDKSDAVILNKSGATGLSLHALPKWEGHDPAQRHMIILQAEKNIDTHMQMLGRIHRAGQVKPPIYTQLMGDIPSEKRPAAVLMSKMASLNANTTADKDSELTAKETIDFMNKYGDRVAAGIMRDFPEMHERLGDPLLLDSSSQSGFSEKGAVAKITGRAPLLPIPEQEQLYAMLEAGYLELIEQLNATGENDLEATTFDTDARILSETTVFDRTAQSADSPFTGAAIAKKVDMKKLGKSYTGAQVTSLLTEYNFDLNPEDAKKEDKPLSEIIEKGREKHRGQEAEAAGRFEDYKIETVDKIEDEARAAAMEARLEGIKQDWQYIHGITHPGSLVDVWVGEDYHKMVALKVHQAGKPRNPLAMGTWRVTFAVPDSMRRVTYPFSYLVNMEAGSRIPQRATSAGELSTQWLGNFDRATRSAREERTIITGNLLAAYGRYKQGRIINFTNHDKSVDIGVLMPVDFDLEGSERERPIFLNNVNDIGKVLGRGVNIRGTNDDVRIFPGVVDGWNDTFSPAQEWEAPTHVSITVPAAKASGSKYYLNHDLLGAVGRDFVKVKSRMVVNIPIEQAHRALDVLINRLETPFQNVDRSGTVRDVLGIQDISFNDDGSDVTFSKKKNLLKKEGGKYGLGTNNKTARILESALQRRGVALSPGAIREVSLPDDKTGSVRRIEAAFGRSVVFVENTERDIINFEGVNLHQNPNTLYIDAATRHPLLQVAGHELTHSLRRENLSLFNKLMAALEPMVQGLDKFEKTIDEKDISPWRLREELIADFIGDHITETRFWHDLHSSMPKFVKAIAFRVKQILNKIKRAFKGKKSDQYFTDVQAAIDVVDQFLKDSRNNKGPQDTTGGDMNPAFSRRMEAPGNVITEKFASDPTVKEQVSDFVDKAKSPEERTLAMDRFITKGLDNLHFIKKRLGDETYKMHRMLTGIKSASFAMFLEHGPFAWEGNALTVKDKGKGVLPFLRSIGDDWQDLLYWVSAKRAEQLDKEGRENWLDKDARDEIFARVGTHSKNGQSWAGLNLKLQSINKNVLDIAEQAGLIDPESRAIWESNFYIPFYRIMEDDVSRQEFLSGPNRSKKHISAQIKKLKGGEAKIGDPLENLLKNWMYMVDAAARNKTRAKAFEVGTDLDIIQEVPKKELLKILGAQNITRFAVIKEGKTKARNIFDTREDAEAWAYDLRDQGKGYYKVEPRKETKVIFGSMKDYGILSFQKNGETVYFKTEDQDLYESLAEIDATAFNNILMKMMGGAKRLLSYSATFGPAFRVRNMVRDTVHTAVVAKNFRPFLDTGLGFIKAMKEDQDYIEFMASGFGFGSSYVNAEDPATGSRFIKKIVKGEGKGALKRILDTPRKALAVWEKIGSASENATRLGLYKNLKDKGASNFDAGFEGRDLMDFSMRGSAQTVQMLTRIVPFLNARVQGLYKLGRASKENPKAFMMKSAILTTAALALWSLYKDDDRYIALEDWEKWTYFHFWLGDDHYRIPKPFEIGALFASLPESVANTMNGTDEADVINDWFTHTVRDTFNVDMPQLFKPIVEERFNMSTFKNRPIVPKYMGDLAPSEQYYPHTSDTARMLGGALDVSPLKIQHYIRGYFSTIGMMTLAVTDIMTREAMGYPSKPEGGTSPFGLGIHKTGTDRTTKDITRFYEFYQEVYSANRTLNHYLTTGQREEAKDFFQENKETISLKKPVYKIRAYLTKINQEIKRLQRSKTLSPSDKREKIDKLNSTKAKVTRTLFKKIRETR